LATCEIENIRLRIDSIDSQIITLLEERMKLCRRIKEAKRRAGKPVRDPTRERQVLERAGRFRRVFEAIIELCIKEQGG